MIKSEITDILSKNKRKPSEHLRIKLIEKFNSVGEYQKNNQDMDYMDSFKSIPTHMKLKNIKTHIQKPIHIRIWVTLMEQGTPSSKLFTSLNFVESPIWLFSFNRSNEKIFILNIAKFIGKIIIIYSKRYANYIDLNFEVHPRYREENLRNITSSEHSETSQ